MNSPADRETTCTWSLEDGGQCELDLNITILQNVSVFAPVPPERLRSSMRTSRGLLPRRDFLPAGGNRQPRVHTNLRQGSGDPRTLRSPVLANRRRALAASPAGLRSNLREGRHECGMPDLDGTARSSSCSFRRSEECARHDDQARGGNGREAAAVSTISAFCRDAATRNCPCLQFAHPRFAARRMALVPFSA